MAYYQCFKDVARNVYCSSYMVKNHDEGAAWVQQAIQFYGLQGSELLGKPYESPSIPNGARLYPAAVTATEARPAAASP